MSASGKFPLRTVLYGLTAVYLLGDLLVFNGPLRRQVELAIPGSAAAVAHDKSHGVVARVFKRPIHASQLERAVRERLWLEGKSIESLTPAELAPTRLAALHARIDHEILREKIRTSEDPPAASPWQIDERQQRLLGRFKTKAALESAMSSQGIRDEEALRGRLAARIQQEQFIERQIATGIRPTDEEARVWYSENLHQIGRPERIEARHIFIPTLDTPPEEAKRTLEEALANLTAKSKDFATLAREVSKDPATRESGGSLGWMTRDRLPADLADPLFSLETGMPTLLRSRLGWHLIEVTARKAAEFRTFDEAKPEIFSALESLKRRKAIAGLRESWRQQAHAHIVIHHDMLEKTPP
jgi:parvulin-like peptidyl-prolyl isomerase